MRHLPLLLLALAAVGIPTHLPGTDRVAHAAIGDDRAATANERALWIWRDPAPAQARFAARRGFDQVYLQVLPGERERQARRALFRVASERGVEVWAMGGRADWVEKPAAMLALARRARRAGHFAGVVLDVEPHALDAWDDPGERPRLMRALVRGLERTSRAAGDLPVLAAVPFWYDHDAYRLGNRSFMEEVLDRVDGLIVMAYRDQAGGPDGIIRLATDEVAAAGLAGKTVMIAVQTAPDELDKLGFAEEGAGALRRELAAVERAFANTPGFGGISVHHYRAFRRLMGR